jgi:RNA-binding protein
MVPLSSRRRGELRAEAHRLSPIVIIGDKGLTDEVVAEIDRSLKAHELIKVRATSGEREQRDTWLATICERLQAHAVQQIGKVFVIYREAPDEPKPKRDPAAGPAKTGARGVVVTERGRKRQLSRDADKRKARDVEDMIRKGKIKLGAGPRSKPASAHPVPAEAGGGVEAPTGISRPRSRTPAPLPESAPRRRRPRTSR